MLYTTIVTIAILVVLVLLHTFVLDNKQTRMLASGFGSIAACAVWAWHFIRQVEITQPLLIALGLLVIAFLVLGMMIKLLIKRK